VGAEAAGARSWSQRGDPKAREEKAKRLAVVWRRYMAERVIVARAQFDRYQISQAWKQSKLWPFLHRHRASLLLFITPIPVPSPFPAHGKMAPSPHSSKQPYRSSNRHEPSASADDFGRNSSDLQIG